MIVQPGFLDHWKTRLLVDLCGGDETAPLMVWRLWEHCQQCRKSRFDNLSDKALVSICRSKLSETLTRSVLVQSGFLDEKGSSLIVHDWNRVNAFIVSCWNNGRKGGRPKVTHTKPMGSSKETHRKPIRNPYKSNLISTIKEEGSGEKHDLDMPANLRTPAFSSAWKQWEDFRRELKKPITISGRTMQLKKLADMGEKRAIAMIEHTIFKGWQGLVEESTGGSNGKPKQNDEITYHEV